MSDYPFNPEDITRWFESNREEAISHGVLLIEIKQNYKNKPSAFADYDSDLFIGRIVFWVSGEVDFEIVRRSDAEFDFHHEDISNINEPRLRVALNAFLQKMSGK